MGKWVKVGGSADLRISRADKLAHQNKRPKRLRARRKACECENPPTMKSLLNNAHENKVIQKGFLHKPPKDTHTNISRGSHTHTQAVQEEDTYSM